MTGLAATVAWSLSARAQQSANTPRIGYLTPGLSTNDLGRRNVAALRQGLNELGYFEGQNIAIEYRFAEGDFDRLQNLAAELVRLDVAIIVAGPTPAAVAAWKATRTIPIVMINVGDPVGLGLIASLARPGGNVTGLAFTVGTETFGKGLEHLKEAVPDLHRVAVLSNPANPAHALVLRDLQAAARATGVELRLLEARVPDDFDRAFSIMAEQRVGGLYVIPDVLFMVHARRLAVLAIGHRLPSLHQFREEVEAGGLMTYGHSNTAPWRRAATYVDQILRGATAANLPVQQPTQFELFISLKTANALGLTIPPTLLARADEVIE